MRAIVIGGRSWGDGHFVRDRLDVLHKAVPFSTVIEYGGRKRWDGRPVGVGYFAAGWCAARGVNHIHHIGPRLGSTNFSEAVAEHHPDVVIQFPGGKDTARLAEIARELKLTIVEVPE